MARNIVVIGGGPAAVFAAIEAKKRDAAAIVTLVTDETIRWYGGEPVSLDKAFNAADGVLIVTDHPDYRAIRLDSVLNGSRSARDLIQQGDALWSQGDRAAAADRFLTVLANDPKDAQTLIKLGTLRKAQGRDKVAQEGRGFAPTRQSSVRWRHEGREGQGQREAGTIEGLKKGPGKVNRDLRRHPRR